MQKKSFSQSGLFHPRVLSALSLGCAGVLLAVFSFAAPASRQNTASAQNRRSTTAPMAPAAATIGPSTNLSNGITFDHATWNDPIRMVGEPDIVIDYNGGIYVSGPGGSTTQASWFWKSTDKGLQWHLIGCPLKSNCQNGGGDTEITIGRNNDVFASDLQTLTCNSALRSYDQGATWLTSEGCFPGTDRQWMGIYDPNSGPNGRRVYLSANGQAVGCYFLVSTDNGVTYLPTDPVNNPDAGIGGSCIGRFAVNPVNGHIYVPGSSNTKVSLDGGVTFLNRARPAGVQGNFFANIAIDTAGNLWQGWTTGCSNPGTTPCKTFVSYSTDEAQTWSTPIQVNTGAGSPAGTSPDLRQMLFPWTVVGDPGRVAIVYYATTDAQRNGGFPGSVNALWHAYMSISTNALDPNPVWTQVQMDEHAMHRATVCTGGFPGCLTANSDRSMADFFAVDKDPDGRVFVAYNENSDLSEVAPGEFIGKPINAVIRLRTGPSLYAAKGDLLPDPAPANLTITSAGTTAGTLSIQGTHGLPPGNWASDPQNDAPFPVIPVASANHPALDIVETSVTDDGANLTVTLKMNDLSPASLADAAATGGTPTWMVVWWEGSNGLGPASMTSEPFHSHWFVKWLGQNQFVYGKVGSIDFAALGAPTPKALTYLPSGSGTAVVNGNTVTMTVPLANVGPLAMGDKIDHISAYSLIEHADVTLNEWADQVKTFSYIIGTPAAGQHTADGYVQISTDNFATSTIATLNNATSTWSASLPLAASSTVCARQVLSKNLYTSVWDDVQAGPTVCTNVSVPTPTAAVSRKTHGSAGAFDIGLPLIGAPGIECRAGQPAAGEHTVVVSFANPILGVASANCGGQPASTSILGNEVTIQCSGVTDRQTISVNLTGVNDGVTIGTVSIPMAVLLGDVTGNGAVSNSDIAAVKGHVSAPVTTTSFRNDVTANGAISNTDISITKTQVGSALP
ncbi:MAG TPA: dockerin type I domain-containing protein [Chthoniobacterales bacterium]|nr:dockerin type I domain-containing protein [Chthoniobacterales bacterium]